MAPYCSKSSWVICCWLWRRSQVVSTADDTITINSICSSTVNIQWYTPHAPNKNAVRHYVCRQLQNIRTTTTTYSDVRCWTRLESYWSANYLRTKKALYRLEAISDLMRKSVIRHESMSDKCATSLITRCDIFDWGLDQSSIWHLKSFSIGDFFHFQHSSHFFVRLGNKIGSLIFLHLKPQIFHKLPAPTADWKKLEVLAKFKLIMISNQIFLSLIWYLVSLRLVTH